ncbi:DUF1800 domain-containing protein [Mucilaginibacter terrigena]|uniref:DUF1800 domain-containing protein n=1 Tax=Mucilaginibacter terrigena TaxID=2492395 RepID=A0A4Q5LKK9_9SPHI|nr:DUF1800 domain-containing protein [Mucilaginibacter terrigena]RYU90211.1 DUF1800 domain-containing protein [Mucilaginibacter terrigena]
MNNFDELKHLYSRAGFGITFNTNLNNISLKSAVSALFADSETRSPIHVITENIDMVNPKKLTPEDKRIKVVQRHMQDVSLNTAWLLQMCNSKAQLREKMTLFWHNHFACSVANPLFEQQLNNVHREYALGNFRDMLLKVSQSPAMLHFLNNEQNRKSHPNENFAREVMELFTLGRGNYTEQDIKEAARAFTGWTFNKDTGDYIFNAKVHDTGPKNFRGKSGSFTGEQVIDMLLADKQTARFICTKLYRYLVNEVPDKAQVEEMATVWYNAKYEVRPLLEHVFKSTWFYEDKNVGTLIKSPIELLCSLTRQFYVSYQDPLMLMQVQRVLGQTLFRPPNVAGWSGGRNWIDSSSLMARLKLPSTILSAGVLEATGKVSAEDELYVAAMQKQDSNVAANTTKSIPNWAKLVQSIPKGLAPLQVAGYILNSNIGPNLAARIKKQPDTRAMLMMIVSTPEYQLC